MALMRSTTCMKMREIFHPRLFSSESMQCLFRVSSPRQTEAFASHGLWSRGISSHPLRCAAVSKEAAGGGNKSPARMAKVQEFLLAANERSQAGVGEKIPKITLDHVTVNFARSGGPGGQNVNKVNTKVDMRFNVKTAGWLSDRVKQRILQMERNRINKEGELVISSTRTRTQKGNVEDALAKLQVFTRLLKKLQEIIDQASYVPPPPSEETIKRINKLAAAGEQKRLDNKKAQSDKKAFRRTRDFMD